MIWTPELLTAAADAFTRKQVEALRLYASNLSTFERAWNVPIRLPKEGQRDVSE